MRDDPIPALKRQLARDLIAAMGNWETAELCHFLRADQPTVSRLRAGRVDRFSLEALIRFLGRMRLEVELSVRQERVGATAAGRTALGRPHR